MARLPIVGGDEGTWGGILNDFLSEVHQLDGTLKSGVVDTAQLQNNAIKTAQIADGAVTNSKLASVGIAHGLAEIDADGDVINTEGEKLLSSTAATGMFVTQGPDDPSASLPGGTEYVWMKTDGDGTLLDIVSGVA